MDLIAIIDERGGLTFGGKRLSRDRMLTNRILDLTKDALLICDEYSSQLFPIVAVGNFSCAKKGHFYFMERIPESLDESKVDKIWLFKWNRHYPSDVKFPIDLSKWVLENTEDFKGNSHEMIILEVYSEKKTK